MLLSFHVCLIQHHTKRLTGSQVQQSSLYGTQDIQSFQVVHFVLNTYYTEIETGYVCLAFLATL